LKLRTGRSRPHDPHQPPWARITELLVQHQPEPVGLVRLQLDEVVAAAERADWSEPPEGA
jgi:hypothetical protein